jgi:hypothetical protein
MSGESGGDQVWVSPRLGQLRPVSKQLQHSQADSSEQPRETYPH